MGSQPSKEIQTSGRGLLDPERNTEIIPNRKDEILASRGLLEPNLNCQQSLNRKEDSCKPVITQFISTKLQENSLSTVDYHNQENLSQSEKSVEMSGEQLKTSSDKEGSNAGFVADSADTKVMDQSKMTKETTVHAPLCYEDVMAPSPEPAMAATIDTGQEATSDGDQEDGLENESDKEDNFGDAVPELKKKQKKVLKPPYTAEEVQQKKEDILKKAKEFMLPILSTSVNIEKTGKVNSEFVAAVRRFLQIHVKVSSLRKRKAPPSEIKSLKQLIGSEIHDAKVLDRICDVMMSALREEDFTASRDHVVAFLVLLNFTDASPVVSEDVCGYPGFLEMMADKLTMWAQPCLEKTLTKTNSQLLELMLDLTYNIASVDSNIPQLRTLSFTQVLLPYIDAPKAKLRMSVVSSLASIVDEKDCELLKTNTKIVSFLLAKLGKALRSPIRKELGWGAHELCRTVGRLARNDANKRLLVEEGCLPLLAQLALSDDPDEQKEAFGAIWMLAFDDANKESIMAEPELMKTVVSRAESCDSPELSMLLQGILWTLREQLVLSKEFKHVGQSVSVKTKKKKKAAVKKVKPTQVDSSSAGLTGGHVMMSYQWADQKVLLQIRDELKRSGFAVWMDVDQMGGSTLQAMAEAVEDAVVVLVCMSSKYKDSPNCRAEAEYAFQQRKRIIPLMMERGYRPDGWLGMVLGAKLFHDYSGKYPFDQKMGGLVKELRQLKTSSVSKDVADAPAIVAEQKKDVFRSPQASETHRIDVELVKTWTSKEVKTWLLTHSIKSDQLHKLTGKEVAFLKHIKHEAPEFFYHTLRNDLGLKTIAGLMDFSELLNNVGHRR